MFIGAGWAFSCAFYIFTSGLGGSAQKPSLFLEYRILLPLLPVTNMYYSLEALWIYGPICVFIIYVVL